MLDTLPQVFCGHLLGNLSTKVNQDIDKNTHDHVSRCGYLWPSLRPLSLLHRHTSFIASGSVWSQNLRKQGTVLSLKSGFYEVFRKQ